MKITKPVLIPTVICDVCKKEINEDGYINNKEKDYHPYCYPKD